jgi:hypothetical protein
MLAALPELAGQVAALLAARLLHGCVSAPAVVYCAHVLFAVFVLRPAAGHSVHECNRCLLHTTLRVSCTFLLYGALALFNRDPALQ